MKSVFSLVLMLALSLGAQAETLRIGAFAPAQSVGVQEVIIPWIEAVEADHDDLKLRGFWGGSLGRDPFAQYDLVKNGVLDIAWVMPGYTAGQFPEIQIMELPLLARTALEASLATWALYEQGLLNGFDDVQLIGIWSTEANQLHMKRAMSSIREISNKRIRSAGAVQANLVDALGAAPQTLAAVEMNEAIQRGTIDGLLQGWTGVETFRTDQLVEQTFRAPMGALPFLLVMNKRRWESLTPDKQRVLLRHGGAAYAKMAGEAYDSRGHTFEDTLLNRDGYQVVDLSAVDEDWLREALEPVVQEWIANVPNGQAVYDAYVAALEDLRAGG